MLIVKPTLRQEDSAIDVAQRESQEQYLRNHCDSLSAKELVNSGAEIRTRQP